MTEKKIVSGMMGLMAKLRAEFDARNKLRQKHPATIYINPEAYNYFMAAMKIINCRLGIPPPQDDLYSFRGIKLRAGHGE